MAGATGHEAAATLVAAAGELAAAFDDGGRLLVSGTGRALTDARHVAVEFLHPVIVGKRALPGCRGRAARRSRTTSPWSSPTAARPSTGRSTSPSPTTPSRALATSSPSPGERRPRGEGGGPRLVPPAVGARAPVPRRRRGDGRWLRRPRRAVPDDLGGRGVRSSSPTRIASTAAEARRHGRPPRRRRCRPTPSASPPPPS